MTTPRIRQIALVAHDLDPVAATVEKELGLERCFSDPAVGVFGLHNVMYAIGDTFLEIVAPTEEGTTAGRLLERRGGDGGYMVILQVDDIEAARAQAESVGVRVVFQAQGDAITGIHFHPRDVGGAILSVDEPEEVAEWGWAGPVWRNHVRTDVVSTIIGATVSADDPAAMAARWAETLGLEVSGDGTVIELGVGDIRFVPVADDRGEGLTAISCTTPDAARAGTSVELGGITVHLV